MSASLNFRSTSLMEIELSVESMLKNNGRAHLYLDSASRRWVVAPAPRNDIADDLVGDWKFISKEKDPVAHARQQKEMDIAIAKAILDEVT